MNRACGGKNFSPNFIAGKAFYDVFLVEENGVFKCTNHKKTNDSNEFVRRKINFSPFANRTPVFPPRKNPLSTNAINSSYQLFLPQV